MRVAIIGQDYPESFARYIRDGFARIGHEARVFVSPASLMLSRLRFDPLNRVAESAIRLALSTSQSLAMRLEGRMVRQVAEWAPDLVVSTDAHLWPATVAGMRGARRPVVVWFPDALVNLDRQMMFMAPYDRIFVKDPYLHRYCAEILTLPAELLAEACDPAVHRPIEPAGAGGDRLVSDIAVVGNVHPSRVRLLEQISDYDMKIWGRVWPPWIESDVRASFMGEPLIGDEKAMAMRASKVTLNNLHYGEIEGANCRFFEAAGCGAFQVAEWRPSLGDYLEDGKEVVYYRSMGELREILDHWIPLDAERRKIGDAASRRAHAEHTYEHRISVMLEKSF